MDGLAAPEPKNASPEQWSGYLEGYLQPKKADGKEPTATPAATAPSAATPAATGAAPSKARVPLLPRCARSPARCAGGSLTCHLHRNVRSFPGGGATAMRGVEMHNGLEAKIDLNRCAHFACAPGATSA